MTVNRARQQRLTHKARKRKGREQRRIEMSRGRTWYEIHPYQKRVLPSMRFDLTAAAASIAMRGRLK